MGRRLPFLVLCLAVSNLGCSADSDNPQRAIVSGSVSYQGKPIQEGRIRFQPIKGTTGPVSGGEILSGKYRVDAKGGVPVGTHRVEVTEFRVADNAIAVPDGAASGGVVPKRQVLPAKYNKNSELELTVQAGSSEVTKDFRLE